MTDNRVAPLRIWDMGWLFWVGGGLIGIGFCLGLMGSLSDGPGMFGAMTWCVMFGASLIGLGMTVSLFRCIERRLQDIQIAVTPGAADETPTAES